MNGFLPQGQLQMAPAGFARLLPGVPLLVFAFLPCTITGTELAINNNTTDRWLPTEPGQDQSLSCRVQNPSQAEELLWFREDGRVSLQEGNRVNASDICISPVSVDDNGVSFTCQLARNQSARISVVLDVVFPPILAGENLTSVQEEDDATLNCRTKANPVAEMTWYKDKLFLSLTEPRYRILQSSELFQLVIQKVQKSDSGNYTCMAVSSRGNASWQFQLVVQGNPAWTGLPESKQPAGGCLAVPRGRGPFRLCRAGSGSPRAVGMAAWPAVGSAPWKA
uniref:Transmembrane and immunoglobulin domain containing 1 n=1 Tax=Varanus komodoensis TaxID=61221 RepID=A0A8D2Q616_VARKO